MPTSHNPNTYEDVRVVLDAALSRGGGRYTLTSPSAAVRWRARAYKYRLLLFQMKKEEFSLVPGMRPTTPYDNITLTIEGKDIIIAIRKPEGLLKDFDGAPIPFNEDAALVDHEFDEEARDLAKELGIEL